MEYKVIPFTARLDQKKDTVSVVAAQLEAVIKEHHEHGWEYMRLESVSTYIQPDNGCFGIGAKPGYITTYQMIVFSKMQ